MSVFNGVTFAFSHRDKVWKTRYSFTPTCYGYVDNKMLSTNGRYNSNTNNLLSDGFWIHDTNNAHNNFYGYQFDMSVAFVSNYNPSSVKLFKSMSIETNSNTWSAIVTTNSNPSGSNQSEAQRATIDLFERKEGNSYANIPRSEINSTENMSLLCATNGYIAGNLPIGTAQSEGILPYSVLGSDEIPWDIDASYIPGQTPVGNDVFPIVNGPEGLSYIRGNSLVPIEDATPSYEDGYAVIGGVDGEFNTISLKMIVLPSEVNAYPFEWIMNSDSVQDSNVYVITSAKQNGDFMRGAYANFYLRNSSTNPVECFAFNVNYEPTKLDHSLGQNA